MPYFKQNKIFLIHIPKTGGTSIEKYFANKSKIKLGPNNLYFSYYENTIQTEVDNYENWKKRMVEEKNNLEKTKNDHFQNLNILQINLLKQIMQTMIIVIHQMKLYRK